jgi:acyl-CoA thioester hydrolase
MRHGAVLPVLNTTVAPEWLDYNGHMNDAAYALVFSRSGDALMDRIGLDAAERRVTGRSLFTVQAMIHYFREAKEGDPLSIACRLLEHDDKRMRVWLEMSGPSGTMLAASEQLLLSVQLRDGPPRATPWSPQTLAALEALHKAQKDMPLPPQAGQGVALKPKG